LTHHPLLYQINTRVRLDQLSRALGRPATLDDIPDAELDRLAEQGFDWLWLLSVWRTGEASRAVSRSRAEWRREFEDTLPDLREEDIAADEIVRAAEQDKTDILVLGTHGRTGVMKALLGSVAARVVATASCPVLTVRMPAEARR